jgi:hypothetical protein
MVKDAGATISIATTSDLRIGFGLPPVSDFLSAGIPCGISVDTSAQGPKAAPASPLLPARPSSV